VRHLSCSVLQLHPAFRQILFSRLQLSIFFMINAAGKQQLRGGGSIPLLAAADSPAKPAALLNIPADSPPLQRDAAAAAAAERSPAQSVRAP
jgi:hypothetical protein